MAPLSVSAVCPISGLKGQTSFGSPDGRDVECIESHRTLGKVTYVRSLTPMLWSRSVDEKRGFGRWLVDRKLFGGLPDPVRTSDWEKHKDHPEWTLADKADRLFLWAVRKRRRGNPLAPIKLADGTVDCEEATAVTDTSRSGELALVVRILCERGHAEMVTGFKRLAGNDPIEFEVTPAGWVASEARPAGANSDTVFVAMWFSEETAGLRASIIDAAEMAGFKPIVIDSEHFTGLIVDRIMKEIKSARFVIADYTCGFQSGAKGEEHYQVRGGVYWEAGLAEGLGLPVISTVRSDLFGKRGAVHFDQAQFNHIPWSFDELEGFKERLRDRIVALVGWGPHRPT